MNVTKKLMLHNSKMKKSKWKQSTPEDLHAVQMGYASATMSQRLPRCAHAGRCKAGLSLDMRLDCATPCNMMFSSMEKSTWHIHQRQVGDMGGGDCELNGLWRHSLALRPQQPLSFSLNLRSHGVCVRTQKAYEAGHMRHVDRLRAA